MFGGAEVLVNNQRLQAQVVMLLWYVCSLPQGTHRLTIPKVGRDYCPAITEGMFTAICVLRNCFSSRRSQLLELLRPHWLPERTCRRFDAASKSRGRKRESLVDALDKIRLDTRRRDSSFYHQLGQSQPGYRRRYVRRTDAAAARSVDL